MTAFLVELIYTNIDADDETTLDALVQVGVATVEELQDDQVLLTAGVEAPTSGVAAEAVMDAVQDLLPDAVPVQAHRDLVNTTDIGDRVGVTREAVRHWVAGKRGPGDFPHPVGSPSDSKVWEWSAVHAWLRHHMGIWDGLEMPSHAEYGLIDHKMHVRSSQATEANLVPDPVWTVAVHEAFTTPAADPYFDFAFVNEWTEPVKSGGAIKYREPVAA